MPCANCGLPYDEHVNGFAYDQQFEHECEGYLEMDVEVLRDTHIDCGDDDGKA